MVVEYKDRDLYINIKLKSGKCEESFAIASLFASLIQIIENYKCRTLEGFKNMINKEWFLNDTELGKCLQIQKALLINNNSYSSEKFKPVFLLFLNCVYQLLKLDLGLGFEFTEDYLFYLYDYSLSGLSIQFTFYNLKDWLKYEKLLLEENRDKVKNIKEGIKDLMNYWKKDFCDDNIFKKDNNTEVNTNASKKIKENLKKDPVFWNKLYNRFYSMKELSLDEKKSNKYVEYEGFMFSKTSFKDENICNEPYND